MNKIVLNKSEQQWEPSWLIGWLAETLCNFLLKAVNNKI
jgi:hypothetical protein